MNQTRLVTMLCLIAPLVAAVWTINVWREGPMEIPRPTERTLDGEASQPPPVPEIPPRVFTVTLYDDLYPEAPTEPTLTPAPAPRNPQIRLIAIEWTGDPATSAAFVEDESARAFRRLGLGDTAESGARLAEIAAHAIVFELGGQRITQEIRP